MQQRKLGRTDLSIAPLVFGGNVFGWTVDEKTGFDLLDRFIAGGLNAIDTADVYSAWAAGNKGGESETIIGKWMKARGSRNRVVIATKVGSHMGLGKKGLSARYIMEAVEASLRRLQIDTIDLYQSHWPDKDTPYEETLSAYAKLIAQGKVRCIGASNLDVRQMTDALEVAKRKGLPRYETLQPEYNLYDRSGFDGALRDLCRREGIGVITYFSLAKGFLTGKYRGVADLAQSPRGSDIGDYLNDRGFRILDALEQVASAHGAKPAETALAWLIARPGVTAPIASATTPAQVGSLIKAVSLHLTAEEIAALDQASA